MDEPAAHPIKVMDTSVKVVSNWNLVGGGDITKVVQVKVTHEDVFIKPELDEILSDERAILLNQPNPQNDNNPCELAIRVFPRYKIESLTMVCNMSKVELFTGPQKEYNETVYGNAIKDDDADAECHDRSMQLFSYRYDIEINKSGIAEIMLKLLGNSHEICVFGIVLNTAPNPNGITSLLPNAINLDNVQQMLQNSNLRLTPNAEKCKMFMQMYKSVQQPGISPGITPVRSNETMESQSVIADLKTYIETRLTELETKLFAQLADYESRQSNKLDKILNLLERRES